MERALQWVLVLAVWASSTIIDAAENYESADRKLANLDYPDVISIDCGVKEGYTDTTRIQYQDDDIQFGQIHTISSNNSLNYQPQIQKQLNTLRSFPYGKRNCYTLTSKQGKNNKYIVRAYFAYGNYDNKDKPPIFDLYIDVTNFTFIRFSVADSTRRVEAIYFALTDTIDFCLVNIDQGVPFISLLELWPLDSTIYQASLSLQTLDLLTRVTLGASTKNEILLRYMGDKYGRSWLVKVVTRNEKEMNTSLAIDLDKLYDPYKLPIEVLSTAVSALRLSNSVNIWTSYNDTNFEYKVYLHFFDFEEREDNNQKRIMNIIVHGNSVDENVTENITLSYWEPRTVALSIKQGMGIDNIFIRANANSDLPAMLNAYEIYRVVPQSVSATQQEDVDAIQQIKDFYKISRVKWQGDPCEPMDFTWDGLTCSTGDTPRIISLNLSSSKLSGEIDASFSNLAYLEILDLSNNELVGKVPEFFAKLTRLKILNLSNNNLTGYIPEALKAKSNDSLQLSLDGNTGLCQTGSCEKKKSIVPLVASIAASIVVLIIIMGVVVGIWRSLKKNGRGISPTSNKEQLKLKNQAFSYSEVISITDGFKTMIGKGGFGMVYLGTLQSGESVAVKILSLSSNQGYKEFKSEAKFLTLVHHRNVVSLVGYCDEGDTKALIYEYLPKGNLQEQLSDKNPTVLRWSERVQIALDASSGLDYLHNGCKPPIIHRDLKGSNILLDENLHAKISDFGLSRTFANDNDSHVTTNYPAGTPGYLDPEYHSSGTLNKRSDVYSFGVILLELITGQPAIRRTPDRSSHIHSWVKHKLETGDIQAIVDPRLQENYHVASAWKFLEIAMSCLPDVAIQRPDISNITSELKDCLSLEISLQRTMSNDRESFLMDSLQIDFNESDIAPNPR